MEISNFSDILVTFDPSGVHMMNWQLPSRRDKSVSQAQKPFSKDKSEETSEGYLRQGRQKRRSHADRGRSSHNSCCYFKFLTLS